MNKPNPIPNRSIWHNQRVQTSHWHTLAKSVLVVLAFVAGLLALPASAQFQNNIVIKPWQVRVEVPSGFVGTIYEMTNTFRTPTNGASGSDITGTNWVIANLNVGVSGAPAGCTASLVAADLTTVVTTIPIHMNTNSTGSNTNLIVALTFDGSQVSGSTNLVLTATGAGLPDAIFLLPLDVGKIWNGLGNAALNGPQNWGSAGNWLGGGVPGPNDTVIFSDLGAQSNTTFTIPVGVSTNGLLTNCIMDVSATLASLRYSQTNSTNYAHVMMLNTGVTLAINGSNGFSMLSDYTCRGAAGGTKMSVVIGGTNGTFIETNLGANFSILADGQGASGLDMSRLGNVHLDVNRVNIGEIQAYPNFYTDFVTNNYAFNSTTFGIGIPNRVNTTFWSMGLTNYVRAWYVDPYNYNNAGNRTYAMILGHNYAGGGSSAADHVVNMGLSNVFYLDSICVAGYGSLGGALSFLNTNSYALFRNTNGGRMTIFATADAAGFNVNTNVTGDNTKCSPAVDFSKGYVDMQVDRLYLSMDRLNVTSSGKGVSQSAFVLANGIIDANTAILAYQSQGNQTNASNCNASMTVSNTATLKVNGMLSLGYTTASIGDISTPASTKGTLSIGPGGTVTCSNIDIGGVTKASSGNSIALTSGATLVVSNNLGSSVLGGAVGTLSFGGHCTNELFIDGSLSAPYVYATNLTTTSVGNTIYIGGIKNISSYPATVHLMAYLNGTPSFGARMPAGFVGSGSLVPAVSFPSGFNAGIDIIISTNPPKNLVWRGGNGVWDTSHNNWEDLDHPSNLTNFLNGDNVSFDDLSGSTITLSGGLLPSAVNVTNNTLNFLFSNAGGGSVGGSGSLNKQGTATLQIEAPIQIPVLLNQGLLLCTNTSGAISGVNTASGTTMSFAGTISGSVGVAGTATFRNSSTIAGPLDILNGGIVTNDSPNVDFEGTLTLESGSFMYNTVNGIVDDFITGTIATNATLINAGQFGNVDANNLSVSGTVKDMGVSFYPSANFTVSGMTFATNALFIPGGDGIGATVVASAGNATFPGSVSCQLGSTTIFKVNPLTPTNTVLLDYAQSFGASQSAQNQSGCTLVISNVTLTPLAAGEYFRLFGQPPKMGNNIYGGTGSSTNNYPVIVPETPGPGLAWDLRYLWARTNSGPNGIIGVVNPATLSPTFTSGITTVGGTNVVAQFSWPSAYYGWRLETQNNPLSVGLSNNWAGVPGSWTNTSLTITNNVTTNTAIFYRLSFP